MVTKKKKTSKTSKDLDINIKINNLDKAIKAGMRKHNKQKLKCDGGGFWLFGSALAMILSYTQNSSILWAIIHGIVSWIYVIYRMIILYF